MEFSVSIIIPVYNAERYISKCMENVLKQTYDKIEVILVDDGSSDSSGKMCDDYAAQDNRVRVIHQSNNGVSSARNAGILCSRGKYLCFVDIDDEIDVNLVEENFGLLENTDADFLFYCFRYFYPEKQEIVNNKYNKMFCGTNEEFFKEELINVVDRELMNAPWNKMIRKDFLIENNILFDTRYSIFEDITFSVKMCNRAKKICINPQEYYTYNIWTQGTLRTKYQQNRFEAATELYNTAMEYCKNHNEYFRQAARFKLWYSGGIINVIKNICLNETLKAEEKKIKICEICNDDLFRNAIKDTRFRGSLINRFKKMLICRLILLKKVDLIMMFYQGMNHKKKINI